MGAKANIVIDQGADFSTTITVTDDNGETVDLSGYTASGQIRKHFTSTTAYSFGTSINSSAGTVSLSVGRDVTANMESGRYVYDVEITSAANTRTRLVEGIVTVTPEVTRG